MMMMTMMIMIMMTQTMTMMAGTVASGNPELYDPTDTCRPTVGRLSADTLPTPTISSFFTVNIYTALKSPIHSFEFPYICMTQSRGVDSIHKRVRGHVDKMLAGVFSSHMSNHFFLFHRYLYSKFTD